MKFDPKALEATASSLYQDGLLRYVSDVELARESQIKQLKNLLKRSENSGPVQQYLARYDACMRMIEIILLEYGYLLDEQPHATARTIVASLDPSINFRELAKVRHNAKKQSISPPSDAMTNLIRLQQFLEDTTIDIR